MTAGHAKKPKRVFREFQFHVVPVLLIEEGDDVPRAQPGQQIVCGGLVELQRFIDEFPANLEKLNADGK
jgi:hypothetical protein